MRRSFLPALSALLLSMAAHAQPPLAADTVVAKVDGHDVTAAELRKIIAAAGPQFLTVYKSNPQNAIRDFFLLKQLEAEAEQLNLAEQSPWKEEIANYRMNILANAMITRQLNGYMPAEADVQKYYEANAARFEQVGIKIIKIGFQAGATAAAGTSDEALADQARRVVEAAHSGNRSEADAKKLADEIVKQLRAGGDFKALVAQYSEDQETKKSGGDIGKISGATTWAPDALKKVALALKPGETSEPVKIAVAFYILRCDSRDTQPLNEARPQILLQLREQHRTTYLQDLQKKMTPAVVNPEALVQIGNGK